MEAIVNRLIELIEMLLEQWLYKHLHVFFIDWGPSSDGPPWIWETFHFIGFVELTYGNVYTLTNEIVRNLFTC